MLLLQVVAFGALVNVGGGQKLHVHCTGQGSPAVVLESGIGDFSVIWSLVQPKVARFARVCSYDRGGYAWSDPGTRPRTYAQLALELHIALERLHVPPPCVLVGQSYGGLVARGFAARYRAEVVGMVLVDASHEDKYRSYAKGRTFPPPMIALDTAMLRAARDSQVQPLTGPLDSPLDRLPDSAQRVWRWAASLPAYRMTQRAELDWSPEELQRMHEERQTNRATLGDLPLIVLESTGGDDTLQTDLARLSTRGERIVAKHSGHNIHVEDPDLVVRSIRQVVAMVGHRSASHALRPAGQRPTGSVADGLHSVRDRVDRDLGDAADDREDPRVARR
jgi:pimeloyl-ACP methyl ester carboxylesterase